MEFNPNNTVIQLCMQGMNLEDKDQPDHARNLYLQAWDEATNDFERYIAAWYIARRQLNVSDKLKWYEMALKLALKVNNDAVKSALPSLHYNIANCYNELGEVDLAKKYHDLASTSAS